MKTVISGVSCAAVILGAALTAPAQAMSINKDTVVDARGNVVTSASGACVRTIWDAGSDPCAAKVPALLKAAAPAPAAPQKVLKEHKRSYLVFFDFDRDNLTANAKKVLSDIYGKTKGSQKTDFQVVGHADRSGSDNYNLRLSERRASNVKKELTRLGAKSVGVAWKGESQPLVPTKDGIREPQNRRAEIKVRSEVVEVK